MKLTDRQEHDLSVFASELYQKAANLAQRRIVVEQRWYEDTLQYQGLYDQETGERLRRMGETRSKIHINRTRPKTNVLRDRLEEILLPKDEPNWDIQPTAMPELDRIALQQGQDQQAAQEIKRAVQDRRDRMHKLMRDQLEECDYVGITMKVLEQMCKLGTGVCKGPQANERVLRRWKKQGSAWVQDTRRDPQPRFEWVDVWDFFPDMDATEIEDCEFSFELHRLSTHDLRRMAIERQLDPEQVRKLLSRSPEHSPVDLNFSEIVRTLRSRDDGTEGGMQKRYPVLEYHGPVPFDRLKTIAEKFGKRELLDTALNPEDPLKTVDAIIWFAQDVVLKFGLKPTTGSLYSLCRLETSDSSIFGIGLPRMIQHPQRMVNAVSRSMMDNAGMAGLPLMVVRPHLVTPQDDPDNYEFGPGRVFFEDADAGDQQAVYTVPVEGSTQQLAQLLEFGLRFCDDESRLPLLVEGQPGTAAKQTAHGMSLLVSAVNIVFKAAATRFDREFTIPNIRRLYDYNMEFSDDDSVKGDMDVKALGSSVLLVRELQAQNMMMLLNLASTNPILGDMLRVPSLARKLMQAMQVDQSDVVLTDAELEQLAQQPQPPDPEQVKAEAQMQIEQMKLQGEMQMLQMKLQVEMVKLAQQSEVSLQQISAQLQAAQMKVMADHRKFAAEIAVKKEMGTGI